ncbi:hypothetical protein UFOVP1462_34 [uncultured Caudovirales phage]|uniref:Uncharacterized protein n=1 Tax=uncultured Caudovirales phage TaxID=2100421 RepID=A0A6J5SKQ2_9CAUD|nr:hypothetical protein UFOVP1013_34 [uncultured Caudovirales phage]CAB4202958.1 hypothetical protein UFOVP1364_51 [uncultured Caudovirales phage]CAB4214387.1 hypothetical protein UFOVP1462_34 [uncultured Caudovirales phage]CAB5228821.1 hypothetical protein UFOVP1550_43 [uncultured Caudovirales phage]
MADEVIILNGIEETLTALKKFDKAAVRKFNKVINTELAGAERDAHALVSMSPPMSGWRPNDAAKPRKTTRGGAGWPGWNVGVIQQGIKKSKADGRVRGDYTTSAGALINKSAAGAIFEVAGRKTKGSTARTGSAQFLRNLGNRFGKASRLVWRVVDKDRDKIQRNVVRALEEAKDSLQKHLNGERV